MKNKGYLVAALASAQLFIVNVAHAHAQQEQAFAIAIHGGAGTISKSSMSKEKRLAYET